MIWAIVQLSTKETQFFCVMKIIDGGVLPEFLIEEFGIPYITIHVEYCISRLNMCLLKLL